MSNVVEGIQADYHKYVVEGLIDHEVVERQSRKLEGEGKTVVVHYHKHGEACKGSRHQGYGNLSPTWVNNPS